MFIAFWAKPLYHIVDILQCETLRELHAGHMDMLEAESAVALCAEEMGVLILGYTLAVIVADCIFHGTGTIINGMDELVEEKQRQRAGDG